MVWRKAFYFFVSIVVGAFSWVSWLPAMEGPRPGCSSAPLAGQLTAGHAGFGQGSLCDPRVRPGEGIRCHVCRVYVLPRSSATSLTVSPYGISASFTTNGWVVCPACGYGLGYPWTPAYPPLYWYQPAYFLVLPPVVYPDPASPILQDLARMNQWTRPRAAGLPMQNPPGREVNGAREDRNAGEGNEKVPANKSAPPQGLDRVRLSVRPTNEKQHQLAGRFMAIGDRLFREGQYRQAYLQYREAEKAAPDVTEVYFRQGFSLIATRQFSLAFQAFKRGLLLAPDWPRRPLPIGDLYANRLQALQDHRAELALQIEKNGPSPEMLFLLGVHLFAEGRQEEAQRFLEQTQTSPSVHALAQLFLRQLPVAE